MNANAHDQPANSGPRSLQSRRIADVPLTFVDVETTGLSPQAGDRVCEIALIRQEPGVPDKTFSALIDPQRAISAGAFRVNKITPEMLQGAPRFDAIIDRVETLLSGSVVVAHNAPFDLGFLKSEFELCGRTLENLTVIDTLYLARSQSRFDSCSLGAVVRALGVNNEQAHRALGDCRVTQQILFAMIADIFPPPANPLVSELTDLPFAARLTPADIGEFPGELAEFIERKQPFSIIYQKAEGAVNRYDVQVTGIGRLGPNLYLSAHAINRGAARHFRLDRILSWYPYTDMNTTPGDQPFEIRAMTDEELDLLHDLWQAAELEFKPLVRDSIENLTLQWDENPGGFIGAFDGERLVGSVLATDDSRRGWINRLAVHPDFRRTGLGGHLIRAAEAELRRRGLQIIAALIESRNNPSRTLFTKSGYTEMPEVLYYSKRDSRDV